MPETNLIPTNVTEMTRMSRIHILNILMYSVFQYQYYAIVLSYTKLLRYIFGLK